MSIADAGGGYFEADGVRALAFPGYAGPLAVAQTGTLNVVAAGPGGGPRRATFRRFTDPPDRLTDGWVPGYDPATYRGGVAVDPVREADLSFGTGFPVLVEFDRPYPGPWAGDVLARLAAVLAGCHVRVTTQRPDAYPGRHGTVVVTPWRAWWPEAAGFAPTDRWGVATSDPYQPLPVYVQPFADVPTCAAAAAHECGHAFGLPHTARPNAIMQPNAMPDGDFDGAERAQILTRTGAAA